MSVLSSFFAWPDGGVWSNLLASALTVPVTVAVHHRKLRNAHQRDTDTQTQQLKDHIDERLGGPQ